MVSWYSFLHSCRNVCGSLGWRYEVDICDLGFFCTVIFSLDNFCASNSLLDFSAKPDWVLLQGTDFFRENKDSVFRKTSAFTGSHWNELRKSFSQSQACLLCNSRNHITDNRGLWGVLSCCLTGPQKEHVQWHHSSRDMGNWNHRTTG